MRALILTILLANQVALSQELPGVALLPWTVLGKEVSPAHQQWLATHWQEIADSIIQDAQTLDAYANPASNNAARIARRIMVGRPRVGGLQNTVLSPVLCALGRRVDVFFILSQLANDQMLGMIQLEVDMNADTPSDIPVKRLLDELFSQASAAPVPYQQSALQIDIRPAKPWTRIDSGDQRCLDLRLAAKVASRWPVLAPLDREGLVHIRRMLSFPEGKILRPSRVIVTKWDRTPTPQTYAFSASLSESVFGQTLSLASNNGFKVEHSATITADGKLESAGIDELLSQLEDQADTLALSERPQIAKVYGAWVYLDKGRAYGLQMNDRLVVAGQESEIKGHVVGFYSSGLGLSSPRGYLIQEGAIVYIRLGQRKTRVGQELMFDPRQYPTVWPPPAKP